MEVSTLLSEAPLAASEPFPITARAGDLSSKRKSLDEAEHDASDYAMTPQYIDAPVDGVYPSTEVMESTAKTVTFKLVLDPLTKQTARLPMKVDIFPHDTTDSIITTARNFFGLYHRDGVVFEDLDGNTLIAQYENFTDQMTVRVRVVPSRSNKEERFSSDDRQSLSPRRAHLSDFRRMLPPAHDHLPASRSNSRMATSPQPGRDRRSHSATTNNRSRTRPATKSRGPSSRGSFADTNGDPGTLSDSDGGNGSVTSSRRAKKEQVASAEISVENIVEGGRRKRQKFDSSELPLFVPPQLPQAASLNSVSPQRRTDSHPAASPYSHNQRTFAFSHPLQSPQSYGHGEAAYVNGLVTPHATSCGSQGFRGRTRGAGPYASYPYSGNGGAALPTPETTLSAISDEDVARQLMRLGAHDAFSNHGRYSTSTIDDTLSRNAQVSSASEGSDEGSDDEPELPGYPYVLGRDIGTHGGHPNGNSSGDSSGDDDEETEDASFMGESDGVAHNVHALPVIPNAYPLKQADTGAPKGRPSVSTKIGSGKPRTLSKAKGKSMNSVKQPMSPTSLPSQSRKASSASLNFQHQLAADEEDLSSKPRCQRCRKSKKGCDRQRPCQRCKDAGIGIEGCISEDEGNGRKGRYGRHMGVPVKKQQMPPPAIHEAHPFGTTAPSTAVSAFAEKNKKRKR